MANNQQGGVPLEGRLNPLNQPGCRYLFTQSTSLRLPLRGKEFIIVEPREAVVTIRVPNDKLNEGGAYNVSYKMLADPELATFIDYPCVHETVLNSLFTSSFLTFKDSAVDDEIDSDTDEHSYSDIPF